MATPKPPGSVKTWFLNRYVTHLITQVGRNKEKVREIQAESGMAKERVARYEIYEGDVTLRKSVRQVVHVFTVRVMRDGSFERLANETRPDLTVYTDVPAVWGIAKGEYTQVLPGGARKHYTPFSVWDAVRLGKVEWSGASSALAELMLFERRVGPEFLEALKLPGI